MWHLDLIQGSRRIKHKIRSAYGYTDNQILDHIYEHGAEWAVESYKMILEDEEAHWQMMLSVLPAARTAMDKKSGKVLVRYIKELRKDIERFFAPWKLEARVKALDERMKSPPRPRVLNEDGSEVDFDDPDWWKK